LKIRVGETHKAQPNKETEQIRVKWLFKEGHRRRMSLKGTWKTPLKKSKGGRGDYLPLKVQSAGAMRGTNL